MNRLRKYRALTPAARKVVRQSLLLLPLTALSLHLRGMAQTRALLQRLGRRRGNRAEALEPREIARLVDAAAALLRARCLPRSLVLWHFVRDRGAAAELRLGVSKLANGQLAAHAWLEFDGQPLNEHADLFERYSALPSPREQISS